MYHETLSLLIQHCPGCELYMILFYFILFYSFIIIIWVIQKKTIIQLVVKVKIHLTDNKAHVTKDNTDGEEKNILCKHLSIRHYY